MKWEKGNKEHTFLAIKGKGTRGFVMGVKGEVKGEWKTYAVGGGSGR